MFAGIKSATYSKAKRRGQIFTGAADGLPRYRIDDRFSRLRASVTEFIEHLNTAGETPASSSIILRDAIKHDALFDAYPEIYPTRLTLIPAPQIKITYQDGDTLSHEIITSPSASTGNGGIKVYTPPGATETDILGVIFHEIQHDIQNIEGFASGSNMTSSALSVLARRAAALTQSIEMGGKKTTAVARSRMENELKEIDILVERTFAHIRNPDKNTVNNWFFLLGNGLDPTASDLALFYTKRTRDAYHYCPGEVEARLVQAELIVPIENALPERPIIAFTARFSHDDHGVQKVEAEPTPTLRQAFESAKKLHTIRLLGRAVRALDKLQAKLA